MLPKEAILEYQQVYLKDFGYQLSDEEATTQLRGLMDLVRILYKKDPCVDFEVNS